MRALRAPRPLLFVLALLTACKFPYPPNIDDDGRPSTDGGLTDGRTIDAPAAVPAIAFTSNRSGNADIYTMRIDGTMLTNVTAHPAADSGAVWSPMGDRIAFESNRTGTIEVFIVSADGGQATNVSRGRAASPVWAPDGTAVVFASNRSGSDQLYRSNLDGAAPVPLTTAGAGGTAWSPDGSRIVFSRGDGLFAMAPDGSNVQRLTNGPDGGATWKRDGSAIAFTRRVMFGDNDIHVIRPDGSLIMQSPGPSGTSLDLDWSPDGGRIAMWGGIDTDYEIYVFDTISRSISDLSNNPGADSYPRWSPDATKLMFVNGGEVLLMPSGGGAITNVTNDASEEGGAVWKPQP